jgi:hypothetical protein
VQENSSKPGNGGAAYDRYYPVPAQPNMPPASGSSLRPTPPQLPITSPPAVPLQRPPTVRLEQIVAVPSPTLQGRVVRNDNSPVGGAQLLFVRADRKDQKQPVTADAAGNFHLTLASGRWEVYFQTGSREPEYHSKIDLRDNESRPVILVSR